MYLAEYEVYFSEVLHASHPLEKMAAPRASPVFTTFDLLWLLQSPDARPV